MKNKLYLFLSLIIIALALFLRLYKIENRAPFDWDQNRDYQAVVEIVSGKPLLIGPVAKGEGGFFLGPLYYYLLVPGYLLSQGSPISLPITSSIIDVAAIAAILLLLPSRIGRTKSLLVGFVWTISWFAITAARISWNVCLIPLWTVLYLYFMSSPNKLSSLNILSLGILLGLTWHIHAAVIPIALLVTLILIRRLDLNLRRLLILVLGYLLPLAPLFLFDLRHSGLERNLIMQFVSGQSISSPPWLDVFISVLSRFGKNTFAIIASQQALHFGFGLVSAFISFIAILRGSVIAKVSGLLIIINIGMVIWLREVGFPEYYLALGYLAAIIILVDLLFHFKKLALPLTTIFLLLFVYWNIRAFTITPTPFALTHKIAIAQTIAEKTKSVDIRYDLPIGRDSGITPLLKRVGVKVKLGDKYQVLVTESSAVSIFIDGEIAEELGWRGAFRLGERIVR